MSNIVKKNTKESKEIKFCERKVSLKKYLFKMRNGMLSKKKFRAYSEVFMNRI